MSDDLQYLAVELRQVHGPQACPRRCSECEGKHHWLEQSIDPDDAEWVDEFKSDHPGLLEKAGEILKGFESPADDLLLAHYQCKHCPAIAIEAEGALL